MARWCTLPGSAVPLSAHWLELLRAEERHDPLSLLRISYDTLDGRARRLLPVWAPLLPEHPLAQRLVEWAAQQGDKTLLRFYGRLYGRDLLFTTGTGSRAPHGTPLSRMVGPRHLSVSTRPRVLSLQCPELLSEAELAGLLRAAFPVAVASYEQHDVPVRLRFAHLLTRGKSPAFLGFDSPEVELLRASPDAPFQCRVSPLSGERLVYAPAFLHLLMDMSRRGAWYNMPGGASESRFGPGYGKGVTDWLEGSLRPLRREARSGTRSLMLAGAAFALLKPRPHHRRDVATHRRGARIAAAQRLDAASCARAARAAIVIVNRRSMRWPGLSLEAKAAGATTRARF